MTTPGELVAARVRARLERLQFYVDSLSNVERSKLAARYLRRFPRDTQRHLLRRLCVAELAFCEVFAKETSGW